MIELIKKIDGENLIFKTEDTSMAIERAKEDAEEMIERGTTYIFKNINNKIVCMEAIIKL